MKGNGMWIKKNLLWECSRECLELKNQGKEDYYAEKDPKQPKVTIFEKKYLVK